MAAAQPLLNCCPRIGEAVRSHHRVIHQVLQKTLRKSLLLRSLQYIAGKATQTLIFIEIITCDACTFISLLLTSRDKHSNVWMMIIPFGSGGTPAAVQTMNPWCPLKRHYGTAAGQQFYAELAARVCTCVMGQISMAGGSWLLAAAPVLRRTALSALPERRLRAGSSSPASLGLLPASSAVHLQ